MKKNTLKLNFFKSKLILCIVVFCFQYHLDAQVNEVTWDELVQAKGRSITANDIIVIGNNDRLVLNHPCSGNLDFAAKGIVVYGEFVVEDSSLSGCSTLQLTTDWIFVAENGLFQVGAESSPYDSEFQLTLTGAESDRFDLDPVIRQTSAYIPTSIVNNTSMGMLTPSATMIEKYGWCQ